MRPECIAALAAVAIALGAAAAAAAAADAAPVGRIVSIPESAGGGFVKRVSSSHPDGEDLQAGDFLYGDDQVVMSGVVVWVEKCQQQTMYDALAERQTALMPTSCEATTAGTEGVSGGIRAAIGRQSNPTSSRGADISGNWMDLGKGQ